MIWLLTRKMADSTVTTCINNGLHLKTLMLVQDMATRTDYDCQEERKLLVWTIATKFRCFV